MKAFKEDQERKKSGTVLAANNLRYKRYMIEEIKEATKNFLDSRKIGEGGYEITKITVFIYFFNYEIIKLIIKK